MKKTLTSTVVADAFKHATQQLHEVSPEAAKTFDASPPALVPGGHSTEDPQPAGAPLPTIPAAIVSEPALRGVVFHPPDLDLPQFRNGLLRAMKGRGFDPDEVTLAPLGVTSFDEFLQVTKRALTLDANHAVTPAKGTGNYFEIVAWDHPVIKLLRLATFAEYRDKVHAIAARGGSLRDGLFEPVAVKSRFDGPILTLENPRIIDGRTHTELDGGQWVDRVDYVTNNHQLALGVFGDLKGMAAAKDLKKQVTTRDPRLLAAMALPNVEAVIAGTVNGRPTRLPLKRFVFSDDVDAAALSRIGVRATKANTRYDVKIDKDLNGDPYVRMVLYCRTDMVWRIYTALYREMGY